MADPIFIDGAAYFAVSHHDARFLRTPGLAALARRDADGGYTVLHLEHCEAINRDMTAGHPRWGWALAQGLNTLLVRPAPAAGPAEVAACDRRSARVRWHEEARILGDVGAAS